MAKPKYIPRGGEQVFEPPYIAEGVQFFGFVVTADTAKLQSICDRYLNGPSGTQDFAPLVPYVMFVFNKLGKLYAKNPPDFNRGWYSEQEAAVWMPVWDNKRGKALWHHPYMIVDSSYAMAMGREIYGFPKEIGWFEVPDGPDAPTEMLVKTVVVKTLTHDCQAKREILFQARLASGGKSSSVPNFEELRDLTDLLKAASDRLRFRDRISDKDLSTLWTVPIPMVFLKQFRDAVHPKYACFQKVQETTPEMTRLLSLPRIYLNRYEIVFADWASHPVRADLGLPDGAIPVDLAFWTQFDFEIGVCQEI
ncbi:MAG TPA: acetoacetate decarboxylase family protein [Gemmataceae bacterium]|nr:acetoacetate decarboxylase family protein [Gemmataceae bacterium]